MTTEHKKIRFGVMCNSTTFQQWQYRCLQELMNADNIEIALLIIDGEYKKLKPANAKKRLSNFLSYSWVKKLEKLHEVFFKERLWRLFWKWSVVKHSQSMRCVNMSSVLTGVPKIECSVKHRGKFSQYFYDEDVNKIKEYGLDFILRFGFNIIRGEILNAARYGVWSFHHGDEEKYRGSPPCFWEIYNNDPVTGAILQRLTDRLDGGIILHKGYFKTSTSYVENLDTVYMCSAEWPARVCKEIQVNPDQFDDFALSTTNAPIYKVPRNTQMARFIFKKIIKKSLSKILSSVVVQKDYWGIGIINCPIHNFLNPEYEPSITWLPELTQDGFLADPFGLVKDDKLYILAEYYDYNLNKGMIASMQKNLGEPLSAPKIVMDLPLHMSYPYLLEIDGQVYCVPETIEEGEISLYKSEELPNEWVKVATLIQRAEYSDPTVFPYKGFWWLFYTVHDGYPNAQKLYAHYASDICGPWFPHLLNPLKTDIRSSRGAGTPFYHNGNLYRAAQDCSRTYGGSIVVNRILRLSPIDYYEKAETFVKPIDNRYPHGVHTLSSAGNYTIIDGKRTIKTIKRFKTRKLQSHK